MCWFKFLLLSPLKFSLYTLVLLNWVHWWKSYPLIGLTLSLCNFLTCLLFEKMILDRECLCSQGVSLLVPASPAHASRLVSGSSFICCPCAFKFCVFLLFYGLTESAHGSIKCGGFVFWNSMKVKVAQSCLTLCNPMDYIVHGILQARILEWVAFHFSRGIHPTQGSNPGLLHCRWIHQLSHKGSPRILEWVYYPFSNRSSWHRNWSRVSCIAGEFFINWAMREALKLYSFSEYISYWVSKTCVYKGAIFLVQDPTFGLSNLEVKSSAPQKITVPL